MEMGTLGRRPTNVQALLGEGRYKNNCGRPLLDDTQGRLRFIDGTIRLRAVSLLFVGAVCGLLGFAFAGLLGFMKYFEPVQQNYRGELFASNLNYFPQTVSEMVYDPKSPSGKCFFAFCMIGAICMLLSWYPLHLSNVYVGDSKLVPYLQFKIVYLRTFLPPLGMMLVACIPTTPAIWATAADKVTVIIHTVGAVLMIGGYCAIELYTLISYDSFTSDVNMNVPNERNMRWFCVIGCASAVLIFEVAGGLVGHAEKLGICCSDTYRIPDLGDINETRVHGHLGAWVEDMEAYEYHKPLLVNTASGALHFLKLLEYWSEVVSGLFMIASHLTIWYYCPERHLDMDEQLPDVPESNSFTRPLLSAPAVAMT